MYNLLYAFQYHKAGPVYVHSFVRMPVEEHETEIVCKELNFQITESFYLRSKILIFRNNAV
jgi:hypothetical protein